jgi:hypothetical protein
MNKGKRLKLIPGLLLVLIPAMLFAPPTKVFALDDNLPPLVKNIKIDAPSDNVLITGDTITFSADIIDPTTNTSSSSGIYNTVMVAFCNEDNHQRALYFRLHHANNSSDPNLFTATITLGDPNNTDNSPMRGRYFLKEIYVQDKSFNETQITINNKKNRLSQTDSNNWDKMNIYYGIKGVNIHKTYYNMSVTPVFKGTAILNDLPFQSGTTLTKEGTYALIVKEPNGEDRGYDFYIDKTSPTVSYTKSITKVTNKDIDLKLSINDNFAGLSYVNNVAAKKKVAYKSTDFVKKYSGQMKIKKNGTYLILATDRAGNKISKKIRITNIDKVAPKKPMVNKVSRNSKSVTGKAEKLSTIYLYKNGNFMSKKTASSKGKFSLKILKQKKGTTLTVFSKDKAGNTSKAVKIIVK